MAGRGTRGGDGPLSRLFEGAVSGDHGAFSLAAGQPFPVLQPEQPAIADSVEQGEQPGKIELACPRLFAAGPVAKLHVTENVASLRQKCRHVVTRSRLLAHVDEEPARRTTDRTAQFGRLVCRAQEES